MLLIIFLGIFDKLMSLELLNLRKNKITHLSEKLFSKLENLKILQLTSNQITQVSFVGIAIFNQNTYYNYVF